MPWSHSPSKAYSQLLAPLLDVLGVLGVDVPPPL
jgi:hypothetical protein